MSSYPDVRLRRFRRSGPLRALVRETRLSLDQFVMPLFVAPESLRNEALPGMSRYSVDDLLREVEELVRLGVQAVILFGIPEEKDEQATGAWEDDGVVPSDMMDGRVAAIRDALDDHGFESAPILAYSAKYASAFYGPFREAADSTPSFGDRRGYQMDPANVREALRECELDLEEGADALMVKPALPYLDVIRAVRDRFDAPVGAYNVSGEYAMVKAAAQNGWLDERQAALESLTAIKRAGADLILSYWTKDLAQWL